MTLTFAFLPYNSHAAIGRWRYFLIALTLVLLAHLCHLLQLNQRRHTEVVKINEDDCINLFRLLRSSLSAMTFFSAMNRQLMVYRYVPRGIHEHKRRLCEGRGDHSG